MPAKQGAGGALIGCAVVCALAALALVLFLATWWLVQPGGLQLHDAAGRFLPRHHAPP